MLELYLEVLRDLLVYPEFRVALQGFRLTFLVVAASLIVLALLHTVYVLGYNSPLYRRKSPRPGWTKRFVPSLALLFLVMLTLYWFTGYAIAQAAHL